MRPHERTRPLASRAVRLTVRYSRIISTIMNTATAETARTRGVASSSWLMKHLGASWLRVLDVRSSASVRDDRSGSRLRDDDPPRFVDLGPHGWLRAGTWPRATQPPAAFLQAHVPGSTSFDVGRRLFDDSGSLVSAPEMAMAMSEAGVGDEHTVVLVDEACPSAALVAAWTLRRYGHESTLILAGGFPRWLAEGKPTTRDLVKHPFASFTARISST